MREVVLDILGFSEAHGKPLSVQVQGASRYERTAAWSGAEARWILNLREPTGSAALSLRPQWPGYLAHPDGQPWLEVRQGRCVAQMAFRMERLWWVEVRSTPGNLRVVADLVGRGQQVRSFEHFTVFRTDTLRSNDQLRLHVYSNPNNSYTILLRPTDLQQGGEIRHDRKRILDNLCANHERGCSRTTRTVLSLTRLPSEVLIRLVQP